MVKHDANQQAEVGDFGVGNPASGPPPFASDRDPVEVVIEEYTERHRRGENPSIDEYVERYPELGEELAKNFKLKEDPRVTRVGQILRKTSLDELPELINVLRGDMSVIGPRPLLMKYLPFYTSREMKRPRALKSQHAVLLNVSVKLKKNLMNCVTICTNVQYVAEKLNTKQRQIIGV